MILAPVDAAGPFARVPVDPPRGVIRDLALVTLGLATRELFISPTLTLQWFAVRAHASRALEETGDLATRALNPPAATVPRHASGLFSSLTPSTVYLEYPARCVCTAALDVAHEVRHAWQHALGRFDWTNREQDADNYARRLAPTIRAATPWASWCASLAVGR